MAKIFSPPEGFTPPEIRGGQNIRKYIKDCEAYIERVQAWAREHGDCPEAGELVAFPVADGKALYVVMSLKPVKLIHVDTNDAYHFQYAHRLTAKDVREEVRRSRALSGIFGRKS